MIDNRKNKEVNEMIDLLPHMNPLDICGLAKICGTSLIIKNDENDKDNKPQPKDGAQIIQELIIKFNLMARQPRHELLLMMRQVAKNNRERGLSPLLVSQQTKEQIDNGTKTNN